MHASAACTSIFAHAWARVWIEQVAQHFLLTAVSFATMRPDTCNATHFVDFDIARAKRKLAVGVGVLQRVKERLDHARQQTALVRRSTRSSGSMCLCAIIQMRQRGKAL